MYCKLSNNWLQGVREKIVFFLWKLFDFLVLGNLLNCPARYKQKQIFSDAQAVDIQLSNKNQIV